jgi:putative hemolysin
VHSIDKKYIDIHKIFKEKNPGAYKWTPNFLIDYIKKIMHENDLNRFQHTANEKMGFAYCESAIAEFGLKINTVGIHNIPKQNGFILASNHPLGGIDGISLLHEVGKVRKDVRFLVNDILKNLQNFGDLFVPVNKLGSNATENLRRIEAYYASTEGVLVFPAGLVSRRQKGKVKDLEWHKSFVTKCIKYNQPIIPAHLDGQLSNWFYNLSAFRKMIGIKANIEMLYLADEMYKQNGNTLQITIGKQIPASSLHKGNKPNIWAQIIRDFVYTLSQNSNADFDTFAAAWKNE